MAIKAYFNVLKTKEVAIIYVMSKFGIIFQFVRCIKKLLGLSISIEVEKSFTRKKLIERMSEAGFQDIMVFGGETLLHDVKHLILKLL